MEQENLYKLKNSLRNRRILECFSIVNRGMLWYSKLSQDRHDELTNWYNAWLDVTETLVVPNKPKWIDTKLTDGDNIL